MSLLDNYIYSTPADQPSYECKLVADHCSNDIFHFEDGKKIICNHYWYIWNPSNQQSIILFSPNGKFYIWQDSNNLNSYSDIHGTWELNDGYGYGHLNDCLCLKDEISGVTIKKRILSISFDCIVLKGDPIKAHGDYGEYEVDSMTYLYVGHYTQTISNERPISLHSNSLLETRDQLKQYLMHSEYVRLQCEYAKKILTLEKIDQILLFGIPSIVSAIALIITIVALCEFDFDAEYSVLISFVVAGITFGIILAIMTKILSKTIRKKEYRLFDECAKKMSSAFSKTL